MVGALLMSRHQPNRTEHDASVPAWILRVRKLCSERGWSDGELARQTGLSPAWVSLTINHAKRGVQPRRDTLVKMAQVFNEPVGLWLKLGGLAAEEHEFGETRPSFLEFLASEPTLSDAQKEIIRATYMSWVPAVAAGRVSAAHVRRKSPKR